MLQPQFYIIVTVNQITGEVNGLLFGETMTINQFIELTNGAGCVQVGTIRVYRKDGICDCRLEFLDNGEVIFCITDVFPDETFGLCRADDECIRRFADVLKDRNDRESLNYLFELVDCTLGSDYEVYAGV